MQKPPAPAPPAPAATHVHAAAAAQPQAPLQTVFTEDIVTLKSDASKVGFVERTAWEDDDEDHEDDEEDGPPLPEGHVMVTWFDSNAPPVTAASELTVLDRAVFPGDIVARMSDRQGQMGTVLGEVITYDLNIISLDTGKTIGEHHMRMNAEKCRPASLFRQGACVVAGEWLGAVEGAEVDVYVKFGNGALGVVHNCTTDYLTHAEDAVVDAYYVLNESVYLTMSGVAQITWLSKATVTKSANKRARWGRVIDIKPTSVHVAWLHTAGTMPEPESPLPVDSVRLVEAFAHTYGSMGDVVRLPDEGTVGQVVRTETLVDIQWQDGTESLVWEIGVPSSELFPADNLTEQDLWPEDFVLARCGGPANALTTALVRRVNAADRTCIVQSLRDLEAGAGKEGDREVKEEEFSVYDVKEHPDYQFRVGSYVMRVQTHKDDESEDEAEERRKVFYAGGWAGMILSMKRGQLEVLWCDATHSMVSPSDVILVDIEQLLDARAEEQEQEEDEEEYYDEDEEGEEGEEGEEHEGYDGEDGGEEEGDEAQGNFEDEHEEPLEHPHAVPAAGENNADASGALVPAALTEAGVGPLPIRADVFELCETPPASHHYASTSPINSPERGWTARITREWSALRTGLPSGIFVRAFDSRMDLLSVLVIGPRSTPYYDCVFLLDLQLPPSYPAVPPVAFYRSAISIKFHPNLHADGHVCLSLLGTWAGKHASENWSTAHSTLLQLLVSVQGLLLVPEPYFLEAGYDSQRGTAAGVRASRLYNELAVLKSFETMAVMARRLPAPFEATVRAHIRERGGALLARGAALMARCVSAAELEACALSAPLSPGFLKALAHLLPSLESAIKELQ